MKEYTLRYCDTVIHSDHDLDGLITLLAIHGTASDLTDNTTGITQHYDPLDIDSLSKHYTQEQIMQIKTMPIEDLASYGYIWFSNLIDGDMQAIEEFRDQL